MFAVIRTQTMPDHLRGYLSRFLQRIDTGLYVGMVTPTVADRMWQQLLDNCKEASTIMVTSDPTRENGYQIRTANTDRVVLRSHDGITMPATPKA